MEHYEDEYPVIRLATHEDMIDIRTKLDRLESIIKMGHNADAIAARKRSFNEGFAECNSEAVKFCKFIMELLAVKTEDEINKFFEPGNSFEIYHRLERLGLIRWDNNLKAFVEVVRR